MSAETGNGLLIRQCKACETGDILSIINDAALAYYGVIPADCMHKPYMTLGELEKEIAEGVEFWGIEQGDVLAGVMGIQYLEEVTLIRHAYVRSSMRGRGLGGLLLTRLLGLADGPVLVGTWGAAAWAIRFYEKHGFTLLADNEHAAVLNRYWKINARQVETSVVLADEKWSGGKAEREI